MSQERDEQLLEALGASQRLGFLGDRPVVEVVAHARHFVDALTTVTGSIVDIGAGGGVPGLVVAMDRPDLAITMIDRRTKRTDFLSRMVRRLDLTDRVVVLGMDVEDALQAGHDGFDATIARGFGPPDITLSFGARLVRPGGRVIISEPPDGSADRWDDELLQRVGVQRCSAEPHVVSFLRPTD